jgi:trigger factor
VYPEIELPNFAAIKAERLVAEVSENDIDEMIETLRKQRQTWVPVERAAADGDMVNIDYVGKKGGEEFQGGKAAGQNLVLGSERMIPGFENGVIGKVAGDEFSLQLKFPDEYHSEELAGAEVEFELKLNTVSEQSLPEVNEDFFKSFGVEEGGIEAFREEVTNNMQREMKTASRNKLKTTLIDALISDMEVTIPAALMSNEINQLKHQTVQQMGGGQGLDPQNMPDDLFKEQAKRRVTLGLVLGEVISQQNIQADAGKVRAAVEELAATYESPEEVVKWYYSNEEQLKGIESSVLEDEVFDYIIEQAEVSDKEVSYQEVIKPESQGGDADESA